MVDDSESKIVESEVKPSSSHGQKTTLEIKETLGEKKVLITPSDTHEPQKIEVSESPKENVSKETDGTKPEESKPRNMILSPMLGSIDELVKETEKEMSIVDDKIVDLDLELVKAVWEEHREIVESPSTKATLEKVIISLDDNAIKVVVPSSVSKEEITQEIELYQKLRNRFNNKLLNIVIYIDRSVFPDLSDSENTKMYTMREKYDYLSNKNAELNNLATKLKLKIDQE